MKRLCLVFLASLLVGCGGGGGGENAMQMSPPDAPPVTASPADAFTASLVTLVRSAPDSTEPADVDGTALTAPDGGEPIAVE